MGLAMACNCRNPERPPIDEIVKTDGFYTMASFACGQCKPCRKIESGTHPDILHVAPSGNFIKIAQIRELCNTLMAKPYEAAIRFVVIRNADAMNTEAANALLKVLEEPPDKTHFILTASQPSDLLPTIVSRCQSVRFNPVSPSAIAGHLVREKGLLPEEAGLIASMADGSLSKAVSISGTSGKGRTWLDERNWLTGELSLIHTRTTGQCLAFAEKLAAARERVQDCLDIMKTYIRDLVIYKYSPERVINADLTEKIASVSKLYSVNQLLAMGDHVQKAQKEIQSNTVLRLTLEVMIINIARV